MLTSDPRAFAEHNGGKSPPTRASAHPLGLLDLADLEDLKS
jgi:hypothetical protein